MTGIIISLVLAASSSNAAVREIELNPEDRRALIVGLERRVGGKFIIGGIQGANVVCGELKTCETTGSLLQRANDGSAFSQSSNVDEMLTRTMIAGDRPAALVSARSARRDGHNLIVQFAVFDRDTGRWQAREATLSNLNQLFFTNGVEIPIRKLMAWKPVSR